MRQFADLFTTEQSGILTQDDLQDELDQIFDFATSFLGDVLDPKNHKVEILTKEEFEKRFEQNE